MKILSIVVVKPCGHQGVFLATGKEEALCTENMVLEESVYNEKRVSAQNEDGTKVEYRVWNPFRSKLAAAILNGLSEIWIVPGSRVLYLGAAFGTTVTHVSDLVGPTGVVYAVELSLRRGRDLVNMAKTRTNVIPIIEDARHPSKYRMLVDSIADASFLDSTVPAKAAFASEVKKLREAQFKPYEQVTLQTFERDRACVTGSYRVPEKSKSKGVVPAFEASGRL